MTSTSLSPSRPLLFTTFITPSPSLTSFRTPNSVTLPRHPHRYRHRYNFPKLNCSSSSSSSSLTSAAPKPEEIFGPKKELTAVESLVSTTPPSVRVIGSGLVVAAAVLAGYGLGLRIAAAKNVAVGTAVVVGVAAGAAAFKVNSCAPEVAAAELRNYVAAADDPLALDTHHILSIPSRYGVSKQDEAFNTQLSDLYLRFVSSVLPPANEDLKGTEVDTIIKFKNSLGIDDPDAANMHIEIARRIFRQRLETGDREGDIEQRKAFQKLVYVSTLVFGEASAFLLPWKRVFKITDSQVEVAVRDNAQRLYAKRLESVGEDLDTELLADLRKAQLSYHLSDELAEEMFKDHTRGLVEQHISKALVHLKSRIRSGGTAEVVQELDNILAFNNRLVSLGIAPVSLVGGEYDADRKMDDLKLLYRTYVADSLSSGRIEENKLAALNQLKNIFGLGKREAEAVTIDVTSKVYRKLLEKAASSGDLEAAESKAAFLQKLCDQLRFDPEKASQIHEEIYRQKLQQCLADGELSEEDVKALLRVRVLLCVPQKVVEAAHTDICGSLFEKVVRDAIASGVDGYDADVKASVRKAAHGLRLTREAAMSIASKAVRRIFINYIKQARAAGSRTESAKILKKMIAFNTLVVTELVADIKGESTDTPAEEPAEEEEKQTEDEEEWESLQTLRKARPTKELEDKIGKPGQADITVKDDLSDRERADLYKTYLLYCITGEVTKIPFGAQITTKKDNTEFLYLNQLGGILGLSRKEIVEVHRSLAEQTFRQQAEVILADGQMTKARLEQLDEVAKQVGLPQEYAQKVRESIVNSKMAAAIGTAIGQGRLSIKQIRELKEAGVNIDTMVSEKLRENLYRKSMDEIFSSGTGDFDEEEVYQKIPADLSINAEKAKGVVHELARSRLANSLVQAVALLRQRNHKGVVSTLNDLLACDKAVSAEPLSWDVPEEMADLYGIYMKKDASPEKLSRLQYLLGISDATAAALREMGDQEPSTTAEAEEFAF